MKSCCASGFPFLEMKAYLVVGVRSVVTLIIIISVGGEAQAGFDDPLPIDFHGCCEVTNYSCRPLEIGGCGLFSEAPQIGCLQDAACAQGIPDLRSYFYTCTYLPGNCSSVPDGYDVGRAVPNGECRVIKGMPTCVEKVTTARPEGSGSVAPQRKW